MLRQRGERLECRISYLTLIYSHYSKPSIIFPLCLNKITYRKNSNHFYWSLRWQSNVVLKLNLAFNIYFSLHGSIQDQGFKFRDSVPYHGQPIQYVPYCTLYQQRILTDMICTANTLPWYGLFWPPNLFLIFFLMFYHSNATFMHNTASILI